MYFIGYDIGSSSVKASIVDLHSGQSVSEASSPETEMVISSPSPGFAEQSPDLWWHHLCAASQKALKNFQPGSSAIKGIGISYQMHGLVLVNPQMEPIRPAIIWCDSRAVPYGESAYTHFGSNHILPRLLNAPGNFTAAKLAWVAENEPEVLQDAQYMLLPGDYIALRMTGHATTTVSGLSEGTLWDFSTNKPAYWLLEHYNTSPTLIPEVTPNFGEQGTLTKSAASELGLSPGTLLCYRAGDQPNNALSLGVLEAGEVAATAGTSGVVYAVVDTPIIDPQMRVNSFAHVNYSTDAPRYGALLCINGTGILNSWLKNSLFQHTTYEEMNSEALQTPIGAEGLITLPYGNGVERTLGNSTPGANFCSIDFRRHSRGHLLRSAQEGIACAFRYGLGALTERDISLTAIRAGNANMFLSSLFREAVASLLGAPVQVFETDGAKGAALGAAFGAGSVAHLSEAFSKMKSITTVEPSKEVVARYEEIYQQWKSKLAIHTGESHEQCTIVS
jgi:xylulokinase